MIVVISAQQGQLNSPVEGRFGRSPWLVRVNTESDEWEAFPNPGAGQSAAEQWCACFCSCINTG